MNHRFRAAIFALAALGAVLPADQAHAQLGRLRDRVRQGADQVRGAVGGGEQATPAPAQRQEAGEVQADAPAAPGAPVAFVNFDFVPGERVLFAEDFTRDNVGDFPRRLELLEGNGEVAEVGGRRYLRAAEDLKFAIPLTEALPERFTLEIEYMAAEASLAEIYLAEGEHGYDRDGKARATFHVGTNFRTVAGLNTQDSRSTQGGFQGYQPNVPFFVRLMGDGRYTKMYVLGTRVANAPNFDVGRGRQIVVNIPGSGVAGNEGAYIASIRVAAGGRDLYDAISADGRVAVQGILFDTGSDRIRPESAPVLQRIGDMLRGHADLRLKVEGHTDDVGADAANLSLSTRRAAAVRQYLVERFGIDAARLESQGLGETKPAAPNTTPEGRQQNRRVELVRL